MVCNFARTASRASLVRRSFCSSRSGTNCRAAVKRLGQLKVTHARPRIPCKNNKIKQIEEQFGFCSQCFARKFGATPLLCTLRTCTILHNPAQSCTILHNAARRPSRKPKKIKGSVPVCCLPPCALCPLPSRRFRIGPRPFGMISRAGEFAPEADRLPDGAIPASPV